MDNNVPHYDLIIKAQNGCEYSMTKLIEDNMGIVVHYLKAFKLPFSKRDEHLNIGRFAIFKAIKHFDPNKGNLESCLNTYVGNEFRNLLSHYNTKKNSLNTISIDVAYGEYQDSLHNVFEYNVDYDLPFQRSVEECVANMDSTFQLLYQYKYIDELDRKTIANALQIQQNQLTNLEIKFKKQLALQLGIEYQTPYEKWYNKKVK